MANQKGRTARRRRKKLFGTENRAHVQQNDESIELLQWMKAMFNFKCKPLEIALFSGTGRGIMTSDVLKPGSLIVSIPKNALIGLRKACEDSYLIKSIGFLHQQGIGNELRITAVQALCIFLTEEQRKLQLSSFKALGKWGPYIKALPKAFTHPLYWKLSTLSLLPTSLLEKGKTVGENVKNELKVINRIFVLIRKHRVLETYGFDQHVAGELSRAIDYAEYIWTWCCVNTRSIYSAHDTYRHASVIPTRADCYFLVPFLDLLNHSYSAKIKTGFNKRNGCFEIVALQKCEKYRQVFICYGPQDNATLLMEFGFMLCDEPNHGDVVSLTWEEIMKAYDFDTSQQRTALSLLKSHSIDTDWCFTYNGPSWSLVTASLVLQYLQLEHQVGNNGLVYPIVFPSNEDRLKEMHKQTRQHLADLCAKKMLNISNGLSKCQELLISTSNQNDKQHIELVLNYWIMLMSVMKKSSDEIQNLCLSDFTLPNFGDLHFYL